MPGSKEERIRELRKLPQLQELEQLEAEVAAEVAESNAIAAERPLSLDEIKSMTAEQVNQNWDAVSRGLEAA